MLAVSQYKQLPTSRCPNDAFHDSRWQAITSTPSRMGDKNV